VLTLNQIVSQITNLATAHNQIAESGVGDFAEWQAKERAYPILWVFHESTSVNQMEIAFSIRLICADRVIVGEEGDDTQGHEQEVISDTLLVLLDFLAYFQQNHSQPYNVVTSATIDPFTERLNDRLAGNSVTIQIRQPFDWNKCQIPQTGASIPPSVDGLTLYNFCDPSVIARLTAEQVACLIAQYNEPCEDATITINSAPFASVPSGGSFNVPVKNSAGTLRGSKVGSDWVVPDGSVPVTNTAATPITTIAVPSGNSVPYVIPNVAWTDSDGSAESTPYGDAIVCTLSPPNGDVTVSVSDATPDYGDIITITATPTGFTPTSYVFLAFDGSEMIPIATVNPDDNITTWQVFLYGVVAIYAIATDGVVSTWGSTNLEVDIDEDVEAYILAAGITDPNQVIAANMLIVGWKDIGIWNNTLALYPILGGNPSSHKINARNPADTDAAFRLTMFGGWIHDAFGMRGNGSNSYANTHLVPNTHLTSNNNAVMLYVNQGISQNSYDFSTTTDAGGANNGYGLISSYGNSNAFYITNTFISGVVGNPFGMRMGFTDSGTRRLYKDNSQVASGATASLTLSSFPMYLGANNGGGTAGFIASKSYCFATVMSAGMTPAQAVDAYNLVQACQIILGREA
jgi:hypothetical protein